MKLLEIYELDGGKYRLIAAADSEGHLRGERSHWIEAMRDGGLIEGYVDWGEKLLGAIGARFNSGYYMSRVRDGDVDSVADTLELSAI